MTANCPRCREASSARWVADPGAEVDLERVTPAGMHLHQLDPRLARRTVAHVVEFREMHRYAQIGRW